MPAIEIIPDFRQLIIQLISLIFLFFMFKRYGWSPTKDFLKKRQELVTSQFEEAQVTQEEADELKWKYEQHLMKAEEECSRLLETSKIEAKQAYDELLSEARKEVERKQKKASSAIDQERRSAHAKIKDEIVDLTVNGAQQIIKKEIDKEVHQRLFDDFIARVGEVNDAK